MKSVALIGSVVLVGALGVLTFADKPVAAPQAAGVPSVDDPAWDAWRVDFDALLAADRAYLAARDAADAYAGDDPDEAARLEAIRDARYHELARIVYEQHFGKWIGDDDAFEEVIAGAQKAMPACTKEARDTCGKGKVCWVRYRGDEDCSFSCQDGNGNCAAFPTD